GRGQEHDCRRSYTLPRSGRYIVQLRDNVYGGSAGGCYRRRIENAPFATGLFPLGGRRKQTITVVASGGNLTEPRRKSITLPDEPGSVIDAGAFDGPAGAVFVPFRLIVSDTPELAESPAETGRQSGMPVPIGTTVNGRIDTPGEVDRYAISVKKGDR